MASAKDPLDDFELGSHTGGGFTRGVYRSGEGPNCIVMAEIPGITPAVADFARRVRSLGCSVTLPVLFGEPGRAVSPGYVARSITKACVSSEFAAFATNSPPGCARWPTPNTSAAAVPASVRWACVSPAGLRWG